MSDATIDDVGPSPHSGAADREPSGSPVQSVVEITIAEHAAILDGIGSRDPRRARAAMAAHINGAASRLNIALAAD